MFGSNGDRRIVATVVARIKIRCRPQQPAGGFMASDGGDDENPWSGQMWKWEAEKEEGGGGGKRKKSREVADGD